MANIFKVKTDELQVAHGKLIEDFEHLQMALGSLRVSSSNSPSLMCNLKLYIQKSFPSCLLLLF
jgi:hypothetical protein